MYIGTLAQELYNNDFSSELQAELSEWAIKLLELLYSHQVKLMEAIYDPVGLTHDVKIFVRYNANKALLNLGFDTYFDEEEVNPVVLNGLNTTTKTMDFFSMKGNGYQSMKSELLTDSDFSDLFNVENIALGVVDNQTIPTLGETEEEIITKLKDSIYVADIFSASRMKQIEDTLLENIVKVNFRLNNGVIYSDTLLDFLEQEEDEKLDTLLELFNSEGNSPEENAENISMINWLIEYFDLDYKRFDFNEQIEEDDDDNRLLDDYDATFSYRRLLKTILESID